MFRIHTPFLRIDVSRLAIFPLCKKKKKKRKRRGKKRKLVRSKRHAAQTVKGDKISLTSFEIFFLSSRADFAPINYSAEKINRAKFHERERDTMASRLVWLFNPLDLCGKRGFWICGVARISRLSTESRRDREYPFFFSLLSPPLTD